MITRHLQQFNLKRLNIELKQSLANNQLEFYRDIYQNLTPPAEQVLLDRGWNKYAIFKVIRVDPNEVWRQGVREQYVQRY